MAASSLSSASSVIDLEGLLVRRAAGLIERVQIVDPDPIAARALTEVLRLIAPSQVWTAGDADCAMELAAAIAPKALFVELQAGLDGPALVRRLRRSGLACRRAVVVALTSAPTMASVLAARDCGAHELLRKPFARGEIVRRLAAAASDGRDWIEVDSYVGPDRRRFNAGDYVGALRRAADTAPPAAAGAA